MRPEGNLREAKPCHGTHTRKVPRKSAIVTVRMTVQNIVQKCRGIVPQKCRGIVPVNCRGIVPETVPNIVPKKCRGK